MEDSYFDKSPILEELEILVESYLDKIGRNDAPNPQLSHRNYADAAAARSAYLPC